ncbi:helix-turn-helix transcriptional regulator [Streptomyces sp. NPDC051773]|uniref:Helix-turn-helix transcriptional regulator n=1 Tax=Streptomyces caniscabiei TaxID=2746961 RepID=A0A927QKI0_9ACTN|nr:helix-turn-helix transcriptional regulator [Streptomyces caniscabiei]MBD9700904.1 helix-turn-helix transcriptional regulator [Streptomyces caniscabiei]MBD9724932.1 helix-turn-helix transcriptional regulator [Streptomyces caniscabiei]MDX3510497.1 helix-turn-helix transcriptional regulator [Streptomyces caniscabiei]MDX3720580.1 helix-turn-helix transcriptional regulator [Streptomyces caniscabiei]MDX3727549.1 helix-turn-helix transcriptional regulator [Streptomyces caniscabiei]
MPKPRTIDPSESTRAMYGAELRHRRERAGMSQEELGTAMFITGAHVGMLEVGTRRMQPEFAKMADEVLGADGFFTRNLEAARKSPYEHHFADVVEFEGLAHTIKDWAPILVPGLLQTAEYTRAVVRAYDPFLPEDAVEERVAARQARAHIFENPRKPQYWAVLDEMVVRRPVGGPAVMAAQLQHIATMARRHRIIVQVLPLAEGANAGMTGMFKLMTFEDAPPLAYADGAESGRLQDEPVVVTRATLSYDLIGGAALSPGASLSLIEQAAKEYEDAQRTRSEDRDLA